MGEVIDIARVDGSQTAQPSAKGDGWANLLAGLGGKNDKRSKTKVAKTSFITEQELEVLYVDGGIGARIVDVVADDMTREWVHLETQDKDPSDEEKTDIQFIENKMEELDAESAVNEALKWARLYGGSIIVVGAMDGNRLDQKLDIKRAKGIDYLRVVDRSDVDISSSLFQMDPTKPMFGKPIKIRMYFTNGTQRTEVLVHISRCIIIKGKKVPKGGTSTMTSEERFWGMSELQMVYEALRDFEGGVNSVANMLYEAIFSKISLKELQALMAAGKEEIVRKRMELINAAKSIINAIILDADDKYERDQISFQGIPDIIDRFMMLLAGISGIPVTRLFGRSAAGENSTGEGDMKNYYDMIKAKQRTEMVPALRMLIEYIRLIYEIKTRVRPVPNPLEQLTETEKVEVEKTLADIEKTKAETYAVYIENGVLTAEEVRAKEWEGKLEAPSAEKKSSKELQTMTELEQNLALEDTPPEYQGYNGGVSG